MARDDVVPWSRAIKYFVGGIRDNRHGVLRCESPNESVRRLLTKSSSNHVHLRGICRRNLPTFEALSNGYVINVNPVPAQ